MQRLKPGVDIVLDILKIVAEQNPDNQFAQSILFQYQERGGLSKKQLQGLYGKAKKINAITPAKLATLEAIILRKNEKSKSELPENKPLYQKDEESARLIQEILLKAPHHKRVLFLKAKMENNETLVNTEKEELKKITKLLK